MSAHRTPQALDEGVADRLDAVRERVRCALRRAGRPPGEAMLVAVSKAFPAEAVAQARAAGQLDFGESRAQELRQKAAQVDGVHWHFVGRLQRNKVKQVVGVAGLIQSIDRDDLADAVADRAARQGLRQRVLVQVKMADDPAKSGYPAHEAVRAVLRLQGRQGIACEGLMTIPPFGVDPRPLYAQLRSLREQLSQQAPEVHHLSMGMSRDFECAIEEGATIVRVGEAVFGPRPKPA